MILSSEGSQKARGGLQSQSRTCRLAKPRQRISVHCSAKIEGKSVAVIGASRGIGFEFVKQLLDKGNTVYATVRHGGNDELKQLQKNRDVMISQVDVADPTSIKEWAARLSRETRQLDYAIHVAGVIDDYADLDEVDDHRMLHCFQTNTIGPLLTAQALVHKRLLPKGSVLAILTSKMGSISDNGMGGSYAYRASKAAVNQVAKSLSIDLAPDGIEVALLHPGYVRTAMTRFSGLIDVKESVSGMISVLESDLPIGGHWYDYKKESISW